MNVILLLKLTGSFVANDRKPLSRGLQPARIHFPRVSVNGYWQSAQTEVCGSGVRNRSV